MVGGVQASHCSGFSCCGAQAPVVAARGLKGYWSSGSLVVAHVFTTEPPGKPQYMDACKILFE